MKKLEGIHGLRGCGAIFVVLFHLRAIPKIVLPAPLMGIVEHFYLSVLFFFVLSAFTLCHSDRLAPSTYTAYMTRRFFRVAPLFYIMVAWQLYRTGIPEAYALLANVTFTFNLIPGLEPSLVWAGWAVGVEMLFYVILPAIIFVCRGPWTSILGYGTAMICSIVLWKLFESNPNLPEHYAYYFIGSNLAIFLAGIFAYRVFVVITKRKSRWYKLLLPIICVPTIVAVYLDPINLHYRASGAYFAFWGMAFAFLVLWQAAFPSRIMRTKAFQWLGDRSYSIYLFHPIVIVLSRPLYSAIERNAGLSGGSLFLVCAVLTFPVLFVTAEMSYRLVEVPGIRLGRKIARKFDKNRQQRHTEVYPGTFSAQ
jgi:peptidoglycan/LPS O-acetylase OafA/YrhL